MVAPGTDGHSWSRFGYGTDGTMLNATVVFASAVLYSIELQEELPMLLKAAAGTIKVQYNAHATGLDRLVSNMLVSNLHASVNRSMDDPLLLAHELGRQGLTEAKDIRNVMKSYKNRIMNDPNLAIKETTEEATTRVMDRGKLAQWLLLCCRVSRQWQVGRLAPCQLALF